MCGSIIDIQSPTAEIRRGKKERNKKKPQDENIMSASALQGAIKRKKIVPRIKGCRIPKQAIQWNLNNSSRKPEALGKTGKSEMM